MEFTEERLNNLKNKLIRKMLYGVKCAKEADGIPYSVKDGKWTCKEISW